MIERIMAKRLGVFNVQPSWIIILYSVLEWGHACWLSEDREPRILFYNYLICFYIITHLFHIQSGDYEWLFSKAFKALVKECVNGSIKKTELNNEAKKLRGIWSHHNHSHVPKLWIPDEGSIPSQEHPARVEETDGAHGEVLSESGQERWILFPYIKAVINHWCEGRRQGGPCSSTTMRRVSMRQRREEPYLKFFIVDKWDSSESNL